ncbi:unnamed protein product [Amoebophrya sp. A120]|nr:unnamed protein product [Amoebophrya sp. A120]|eukprot:GSA120T00024869001.1
MIRIMRTTSADFLTTIFPFPLPHSRRYFYQFDTALYGYI